MQLIFTSTFQIISELCANCTKTVNWIDGLTLQFEWIHETSASPSHAFLLAIECDENRVCSVGQKFACIEPNESEFRFQWELRLISPAMTYLITKSGKPLILCAKQSFKAQFSWNPVLFQWAFCGKNKEFSVEKADFDYKSILQLAVQGCWSETHTYVMRDIYDMRNTMKI